MTTTSASQQHHLRQVFIENFTAADIAEPLASFDASTSATDVLGQVGGIVTKTDLQKPPVRMWLFGMITIIEMALTRMIEAAYPDGSWRSFTTIFLTTSGHSQSQWKNRPPCPTGRTRTFRYRHGRLRQGTLEVDARGFLWQGAFPSPEMPGFASERGTPGLTRG